MADGISKGRADKVQTEEDLSELKCTPGRLRLPVSYRFAAAEPAHTPVESGHVRARPGEEACHGGGEVRTAVIIPVSMTIQKHGDRCMSHRYLLMNTIGITGR